MPRRCILGSIAANNLFSTLRIHRRCRSCKGGTAMHVRGTKLTWGSSWRFLWEITKSDLRKLTTKLPPQHQLSAHRVLATPITFIFLAPGFRSIRYNKRKLLKVLLLSTVTKSQREEGEEIDRQGRGGIMTDVSNVQVRGLVNIAARLHRPLFTGAPLRL